MTKNILIAGGAGYIGSHISEVLVKFNILSTIEYFLPSPTSLTPLTKTLKVELSIFGLSIINLWSVDVSTAKTLWSRVPS